MQQGFEDSARIKEAPKSREAEQAVIGGLLLDNQRFDVISGRVFAQDFYFENHRLIFAVMSELAERGEPLDRVTITEELRKKSQLERSGGGEYLIELGMETPSAANIGAYADIVHDYAVMRRLLNISSEIADSVYDPNGRDAKTLIDNAERKIFAIAESYSDEREEGFQPLRTVAANVVAHLKKLAESEGNITGLPTPWDKLNEKTAGLQNGDLVIVAGRPSMGKTTFAMNMAEWAAVIEKKPVAVFSLEMPAEQLVLRMLSSAGRLDQSRLRLGDIPYEDEPKLISALTQLNNAPLYIHDGSNLSPSDMRAWLRRLQRELNEPLGLVLVDYLQLMSIAGYSGDNRVNMMTEISRSLKLMAKEFDVPVVALSQLNRSVDGRTDKVPVMSDLRDSGAIEQDADVIMFIYRDEVYNKESKLKGTAEVKIAKQRNGPTGSVPLSFRGQYLRFDNLANPEQYSEYFQGE